jgi:hypothetical protein
LEPGCRLRPREQVFVVVFRPEYDRRVADQISCARLMQLASHEGASRERRGLALVSSCLML